MADITKCTQTLCPNAKHCYRIQAKDNKHWQSYSEFNYEITPNGVKCENYIPMIKSYKIMSIEI